QFRLIPQGLQRRRPCAGPSLRGELPRGHLTCAPRNGPGWKVINQVRKLEYSSMIISILWIGVR
ncbi:MAG: hypothetical protein KGY39_06585, partial [Anaerolineales bacterium]|nr:hypothetical protein [Anaerolineales bacterium]